MINRPHVLIAIPVLLASCVLGRHGPAAEAPHRPNVVLFMADDLGWRDSSLYGSTFYETPNIERLARCGMTFSNAYAAAPICSPTRAAVLTGLYPSRLRMHVPSGAERELLLDPVVARQGPPDFKAVVPQSRNRLLLERRTLAEALKEAGYATAHVGKWHLGWEPYNPENQGFDFALPGGSYSGPPGSYFSPFRAAIFRDAPKGRHIEDLCTEGAIRWIQEHKEGPFFLNYWFFSVHEPWNGDKPELLEKYRKKADPANPQHNPIMGAMVETMDTCLGRVLDMLDELGLAENTVVIFTSDNGGVSWRDVEGSLVTTNLPLRNGKGSIYEGGTREPLVVAWPGRVERGSRSDAIAQSIDFFPTVLEMVGLKPAPGQVLDGVSLIPALTKSGPLAREALYCDYPVYGPATGNLPSCWVRRGDWKLIRFYCDGPGQSDRFELYNLKDDIGETTNLADSQPSLVGELDALIDRHLKDTDALVPIRNPAYRPGSARWVGIPGSKVAIENGNLVVTSTGTDPCLIARDLAIGHGPFAFEFRMKSDGRGAGQVSWAATAGEGFARDRSVDFAIEHDGRWHDYRVALPAGATINVLRIDPGNSPGTIGFEELRIKQRGSSGPIVKEWKFTEHKPIP
jgi:arylsulfatase A-like enzyme